MESWRGRRKYHTCPSVISKGSDALWVSPDSDSVSLYHILER